MGDEDLLEIIGNSKNVARLQKHFKKMFAGVAAILLNEDNTIITGIASREGEEVKTIYINCDDFSMFAYKFRGLGSVVSIATGYGLDGPGIESQWGRDFPHPSRPALGPTQPSVQWVPGLSRG